MAEDGLHRRISEEEENVRNLQVPAMGPRLSVLEWKVRSGFPGVKLELST